VVANALDAPPRWLQRALGWLYAEAGLALAVALGTPWMIPATVRTPWGWSPVPGPALALQYVVIAASVATAFALWWRLAGVGTASDGDSRRRFVGAAFLTPLAVVSVSDVLLPLAGIHAVPRFGSLSVSFLGFLHIVSFFRYGDSLLVPEGFTSRVTLALPDGVAALSLAGQVRAVNDRMADLLGVSRSELGGVPLAGRFSVNLFDPPREVRELECDLQPVAGAPIAVSVSTALQTNHLGTPRSVVVIARDLRELVSLRNRLLTSGRMAAVGELAAGIAHEINNPVTYVRANLSVLREHWRTLAKHVPRHLPSGEGNELDAVLAEGEELIEESLEGVDRASAIVRDVREFSHDGGGEREPSDLNRLLQQTLRVAGPQIPAAARIEHQLENLPLVVCEPQRIKQVFMNLLLNAAQAIRSSGTIQVETSHEGAEVVVTVADDGPGIDPAHLERIFDPFFTTKPVGVGTGLGLAIAFGIVQQHRGRLEVESEPGAGTTFRVWLPVGGEDETAGHALDH